MVTSNDVVAMAACLARAEILDPRLGDVYWHTRDTIFELLLERKAPEQTRANLHASVLVISKNLGVRFGTVSDHIVLTSRPFWPLVCHPGILTRDVLES